MKLCEIKMIREYQFICAFKDYMILDRFQNNLSAGKLV